MEAYYYQKMNKPQQAAYHAMQQGVLALDLLGGELSV